MAKNINNKNNVPTKTKRFDAVIILKTAVRKTISHKIQNIFNQNVETKREKRKTFPSQFHHTIIKSLIVHSVDILLCVRVHGLFPILRCALEVLPFVYFIFQFFVNSVFSSFFFIHVSENRSRTPTKSLDKREKLICTAYSTLAVAQTHNSAERGIFRCWKCACVPVAVAAACLCAWPVCVCLYVCMYESRAFIYYAIRMRWSMLLDCLSNETMDKQKNN